MKILIIGHCGAGKSTLAKKLGEMYHAKTLFLDTVYWLPDWNRRDPEDSVRILEEFLNTNDSWVIDGTYGKYLFERRTEEADIIIEMLFSRLRCFMRAFKRYLKFRGKSRPDITEGCDETFDFEFIRWILYGGRTKKKMEQFRDVKKRYPDKTYVIKNPRQLKKFIEGLK